MCGDVGFPDKLFRCSKCRSRFQHSYCSNYYSEYAEAIEVCDWCECEQKSSSSRHNYNSNNNNNNSSYSSPRNNNKSSRHTIEQHHRDEGGSSAEKATGKAPSPRTPTRRYKLLKDVMC
ncbi:hypothetical protein PHJA_000234400 [Phtheirospermum japonicum]|uniref:PHD-type zinc finger plants domain-containing protein n=1 Tax=Phtheirospermum japonicum TaxID=374723 RepID=A0A830BFU5_9LAMI|nr:hypothetical protein PHJA_000234400 [Phtheirospermum japonicum]